MTTSLRRTEAPAAEKARPAERDAFFDNAKYLAIVLVAVGHAWEPLRADSRAVTAFYMAVYAFHMPAFIVIAGYFSRSFDARSDRVRRLVTGVAVPYVVFQVLYTVFDRWVIARSDTEPRLLEPYWILWFLLALFLWRLSVPVWRVVRWPVPLALGVAAVASMSPYLGDALDLHRVLQFLPFFVLGLCLRPEHFQMVRQPEIRLLAVPVFVAALAAMYWAVPRLPYAWFYHRESAQELDAAWWAGPVMTLLLFCCSLLLTASFFALVPSRPTWFTVLGAGTLYGYLLHGFLIRGGEAWGWYDPDWMRDPAGPVVVTLVAAAAVTVMCAPLVRRALRGLVEPRLAWAFRRTEGEDAGAPRAGTAGGASRR